MSEEKNPMPVSPFRTIVDGNRTVTVGRPGRTVEQYQQELKEWAQRELESMTPEERAEIEEARKKRAARKKV